MVHVTTIKLKLETLAAAQWLFFFEKNWSKGCVATKDGESCTPWDRKANAWNSFGALENVLIDRDQYRHLLSIVAELEKDAGEALIKFDATHSHQEVIDLFYATMARLCDQINWSMLTPLFPVSEDVEYNVLYMDNDDLKAMDIADEEAERRFNEALDRDSYEASLAGDD